jgi:hypothetical protein
MGYGGFFKKVVRIAVPAIVNMIPGMQPLGVALAAAAATAATGGSFKESLVSGATSFIGASVTRSLQTGAQQALGTGPPSSSPTFADWSGRSGNIPIDVGSGAGLPQVVGPGSPGVSLFPNAAGAPVPLFPGMGETAAAQLAAAQAPIAGSTGLGLLDTVAETGKSLFGEGRSAFDAANKLLEPTATLKSLGYQDLGGAIADTLGNKQIFDLGFGPVGLTDLANQGIGGLTGLTLQQALLADDPVIDQFLIDGGLTPQAVQALRQEARNKFSQAKFEELTGEGSALANPFLRGGQDEAAAQAAREEFQKVIASGIERENIALGPSVTEAQFNQAFEDPDFGQAILGEEETLRRQSFGRDIGQAFPGDVFQELDDDIISSIVRERQGPAQEQISRFGARGNLNPTGGKTANLFIQEQVPGALERVEEVGSGVLGGIRGDIGEIRGRAEEEAGGYRLGEDLFDVAPFSEERGGLIEERQGTLGSDVRAAIGPEALFDVSGALRAGGRAQGVVPGRGQNQAFLDQIAARELGSTGGLRNRSRGLGSRGSGAF